MGDVVKSVAGVSLSDLLAEMRGLQEMSLRERCDLGVGEVVHQGDVYLHRVPNDWPRGQEWGSRQVAVGHSVGSRHVATGESVEVYAGKKLPEALNGLTGNARSAVLGPVVVVSGKMVLTHPEHADAQVTSTKGSHTYQVTYQLDWSRQQRVQD